MIGASVAMRRLRELIARIGATEAPALAPGPTGTGKELVARAPHPVRGRVRKPFVAVHCGAIPAELFESELFGHLKDPGSAPTRRERVFGRLGENHI